MGRLVWRKKKRNKSRSPSADRLQRKTVFSPFRKQRQPTERIIGLDITNSQQRLKWLLGTEDDAQLTFNLFIAVHFSSLSLCMFLYLTWFIYFSSTVHLLLNFHSHVFILHFLIYFWHDFLWRLLYWLLLHFLLYVCNVYLFYLSIALYLFSIQMAHLSLTSWFDSIIGKYCFVFMI